MAESGGYREKYVIALKEQERIEQQFKFQIDLLRKTLFQLATVASGMDTQLDASVLRLKEVMRGASGAKTVEQLERVSNSIELFERQRSQENTKAVKGVKTLLDQYGTLQLPNDIKASLGDFSKSLQKRLGNYRQYPIVLDELAKLQQLALDAASNPKQGLWTRLKGGKTITLEGDVKEELVQTKETDVSDADSSEESDDTEERDTGDYRIEPVGEGGVLAGRTLKAEFNDSEDSYESVSERIAQTLANLVENIEPNELIKHRVDIVRLRITRGMDWYVLAVTLEDIRDILFLRYLQADEEFSDYLNQLRAELGNIRSALAGAAENDQAKTAAAAKFSEDVSSGVERMRASVAKDQSVDNLKHEVTEHISFISDALQTYQSKPNVSLTEQLEQLVGRVKSIEKESQKTKEALEEQRHKATHDTLTGLPNREAYIERAFEEMQRFKRYQRPLTMAVCDIDHFKKINDGYGHQAGDKVLKLIAKVISTRLRKVDFIARFGGEEFVILMPETTPEQAFKVLDKIRATVGKSPFRFKESPVKITISFGISSFLDEDSAETVFERADQALYKAKNDGRNRCIIAD